ncbi:hypothetical protein KSS87_014266, partial [Heliosperma pusillum]
EMLKDRGVAPFSKWDKELPKIVSDRRYKAISTLDQRQLLFSHYVCTQEEESKDNCNLLLQKGEMLYCVKNVKEEFEHENCTGILLKTSNVLIFQGIDVNSDYHTFKKTWGDNPCFKALERKEQERFRMSGKVKRARERNAQEKRKRGAGGEKSTIKGSEKGVTVMIFSVVANAKKNQEKLKDREREMCKRKEKEEQEVEKVQPKVPRKEAVAS